MFLTSKYNHGPRVLDLDPNLAKTPQAKVQNTSGLVGILRSTSTAVARGHFYQVSA